MTDFERLLMVKKTIEDILKLSNTKIYDSRYDGIVIEVKDGSEFVKIDDNTSM